MKKILQKHGITELSVPSLSNFIQAMSSPTHSTFQPGSDGFSMARLVFPQALGNAAAKYFFCPAGLVMPRIYRKRIIFMFNGAVNLHSKILLIILMFSSVICRYLPLH